LEWVQEPKLVLAVEQVQQAAELLPSQLHAALSQFFQEDPIFYEQSHLHLYIVFLFPFSV
jgi:hypothetical protein